ncbi:UDP-glucuronate:xylan alpha-glucuronosyltransferase [Actinidia chinensis var. chinensis]|uniref:Hexosyltransferase n=1 Tax=Actinidia chinensis var. chinensis TaxID=1590841 RepID=A0A2R6RBK4_ACTCC|nr:UDP-glucuronate:xylan alpha-glucuronosyltransferase [Actinidia chinensis var. chinensis]
MAVKPISSKLKPSTLFLIFLFLTLLLLKASFLPKTHWNVVYRLHDEHPGWWYNVVAQEVKWRKIKVGLVNMEEGLGQHAGELDGLAEILTINFDRVNENLRWKDFFPTWIDEDEKWGKPSCPEIPMPPFEDYGELDLIVARVPCGGGGESKGGVRDVFRLQVNLIVANMLVRSRWANHEEDDRTVYAVFIGSCGPMWEIFRCDDLLWHEGDYWVYRPDLRRLQQKVLMPVGSCQLASLYAKPGQGVWKSHALSMLNNTLQELREAYVTVLHSSEDYVCGAIALAQSIIRTNSTKDLVLLADSSISTKSLQGLRAAGWKVKTIERIRSPHAKKNAYNEWNYSKLRVWELTEYDKVIFIDSDLIVLKNMDRFFAYPQLSAVGNNKVLFNSGVMLVEPSKCTFETLMEKRNEIVSYNGGDQGFLNEMFPWWHRWPSKLNHLKIFEQHHIPKDLYAIHYLGMKPWQCYMDYDCNWDISTHRLFANDEAHRRWWQVYMAMPRRLKPHCGLKEAWDKRMRMWRGRAREANLSDGHWKIKVKDPRKNHLWS